MFDSGSFWFKWLLYKVTPNLGSGHGVSGNVLNNAAAYWLQVREIKALLTGTAFLMGCWLLFAALPGDFGHQGCPNLLGTQITWSWGCGVTCSLKAFVFSRRL